MTHDECWDLWERCQDDDLYYDCDEGGLNYKAYIDFDAGYEASVDSFYWYKNKEALTNLDIGYEEMLKEKDRQDRHDYCESGQAEADEYFEKHCRVFELEQLNGDIDWSPVSDIYIEEIVMPSSPNYVRDYKQERKTAIKRGETGVGSKSGDATRHRARRKVEKARGEKLPTSTHVHHKKALKSGGSNSSSNLATVPASKNMSDGGKSGNRKGKAAGARKGHKSRLPTRKPS